MEGSGRGIQIFTVSFSKVETGRMNKVPAAKLTFHILPTVLSA